MYKKRKGSRKFNRAACQAGKARARMERPLQPRPVDRTGQHERQIIIRDLMTGAEHTFDLYASGVRSDSYRVLVDGAMCLANRQGWTDTVELAGKSFVRIGNFT